MDLCLGGTQPYCRIDHAAWYLAMVDSALAYLCKKRELLHKSLIVFGALMIWLTSTNYFANQFTQGWLLS